VNLSISDVLRDKFKPMPDSDRASVEKYIETAMEQLDRAYRELSNNEQLHYIMDAVQRFRDVVSELQDVLNKIQPYAATDTEAAKLAVKLGMVVFAIQLVQQKLAEIQAAIAGATQPVPTLAQQPTATAMRGMGMQ